ncbi:hypothetical protein L195_g045245 [Trifolium pratense]|uniref:Uncharacterized protein n=1 Tax=Trifolium pratense TaxID=57577 RepID=A0A2K3MEB6_TRIPR|nr:hypothetical protein L195_g045245 [Trifolium pratense]
MPKLLGRTSGPRFELEISQLYQLGSAGFKSLDCIHRNGVSIVSFGSLQLDSDCLWLEMAFLFAAFHSKLSVCGLVAVLAVEFFYRPLNLGSIFLYTCRSFCTLFA